MLFMVIETYRGGDAKSVYQRFRDKGRMLPDGLTYVDSWIQEDLSRCFQPMECEDAGLLQRWADKWTDLIEFEFVPSDKAKALAARL
ncbi:MAG TPA: DUF3303 family protein [Alphaproteobacteria bacterium]